MNEKDLDIETLEDIKYYLEALQAKISFEFGYVRRENKDDLRWEIVRPEFSFDEVSEIIDALELVTGAKR